ncbi:low molecular weight protein-tyrosine-phosphatase [Chitinibacter tainanensis]|uniref:low molecular weight protein-tyrosine-phosphatase n=1 Tax=Chitinibacter tainanensis TaxID=230667 RepID=UPI002352FCD7|nr:low molecular weight protein-tyrosine-phosphatase [Chitinibacter tainanensis]
MGQAYSVLMVCTGNICRSPTADGVLRQLVAVQGLQDVIEVDSAGTYDYHVGEAPDRRAQQHARKRGYDLSNLRARQVAASDFSRFDLILAMDKGHFAALRQRCPAEFHSKIQLFLDYAAAFQEDEVPDPYYGGAEGFEHVLDLVEDGCRGVLAHVQHQLAARTPS